MTDEIKEQIEDAVNRLITHRRPPAHWGVLWTKEYEKKYAVAKDNYRKLLMALVTSGLSFDDAWDALDDFKDWAYTCGREDALDEAAESSLYGD